MLYEMLTGIRAFRGDDVTDIITSVMRDKPDWQALPATTPASIRTLLRRCGTLQSVAITSSGGFRAGVAAPLFALGGIDTDGYNYAIARDGTRFLVMRPSASGSQPRMSVIVNWPASLAR